MKAFWTVLLLILSVSLSAQELEDSAEESCPRLSGVPWLGVTLSQVEGAVAAQLKEVPLGFGLLVREVEPNSPAAEAGLMEHDVIWKFDDQLLANKGQLYFLMSHRGCESEVMLAVVRKGQLLDIQVLLGSRPQSTAMPRHALLTPPIPGLPMRQVDHTSLSGFITQDGITVHLRKVPSGYEYQVLDGEVKQLQGSLAGNDESAWPEELDETSRRKIRVLIQSLAHSGNRKPRVPRVRRVPSNPQGQASN